MHCDCRKPVTCQLRLLSDEYQANRKRFTGPERKNLKKYIRHDLIVYEPEKCIKCGRCVTITSQYKEELGLTFTGRGFDIRIGVPFGGTLQEGIKKSAFFCVENCPTGALAFKDQEEGVEYGKRMRLTKKGWSGILPALLIPGLLLISMFLPAQPRSAGCWSSYRGDAQLTGVSLAKVKSPLKLLWSYNTGDAVKSSPIVCNNSIYVGSNDGFLYALDLQGALLWKFNAGNSIESPPLLIGGQVIFGTLEGTIFSLDGADGKERWRYVTEGQISGAPNVVQTGKGKDFAIIAGSYDYNLHAVEGSTGKPLWKYETDNFINGTPAMFGKIAIFGGCDGHLHLVNTETGQLIDKIDIGTYMASSPSVSGTRVYFGNYDGEFFCFDMKTKKMVWKTDGGGPFLSSPAVSGKVAVIGSQNKTLYGYDTGSGKILWTFKALGKIDASPVIAGNRVIVASADGRLRILELPTGQESWSYEVGSPMYSTPAVTSGGIVVGADDGGIYMFATGIGD
jgi:outer membrane protein assembly factor BamB/ferredoxin